MFGYLKKYPKIGYEINPQPMTIDANYEKVQMNYNSGNHYANFSEKVDEKFPGPILD